MQAGLRFVEIVCEALLVLRRMRPTICPPMVNLRRRPNWGQVQAMWRVPILRSRRAKLGLLVILICLPLAGCGPSIHYATQSDPFTDLPMHSSDARDETNSVTLCYMRGDPKGDEMQSLALDACRGNGPVSLVSDDGVAGTCPLTAPFAATYQCGPDPGRQVVR